MREPEAPEFPSGANTQTQVAMIVFDDKGDWDGMEWKLSKRARVAMLLLLILLDAFEATKRRRELDVRPSPVY